MRINNLDLYNNFSLKTSLKEVNFSSNIINNTKNISPKAQLKKYVKPLVDFKKNVSIEELKKIFLTKFFQKKELSNDSSLKDSIERMFRYLKSLEQVFLANSVLEKDFLLTDKLISNFTGIIQSANSKEKCNLISKILNNSRLCKNSQILKKLEPIMYSCDSSERINSRTLVLDKILSSQALIENEKFIDNIGAILYNTDDQTTAYKTIKVFDSILSNEKYSRDENFIETIGQIIALQDFDRNVNPKFVSILENYTGDSKQKYILKAIASMLGKESADIFSNIIKDDKLIEDESFLEYLPDIIYSINKKNYQKSNDIINYIKKHKNKNPIKFNKDVIFEYMYENYNSTKEVETFLNLKRKAIEKKHNQINTVFSNCDKDIEDFFDTNREKILAGLDLLGTKNLAHALYLKHIEFGELCENCKLIKENIDKDYYDKLLLKINPQSTEKYISLTQKVIELKRNFSTVKTNGSNEELKALQKEIDTCTKLSRDILSSNLGYDPDTVINKIKILSSMVDVTGNDNSKVHKFIDAMQELTPENEKIWKELCYREIFNKIEEEYNQDVADKLNLINNKYLGKIILANQGFLKGLKDIVVLIKNNPNKSIKEIFNNLEANKITKLEFKKNGINYDKWIDYDEKSCVTLKNNKNITIKKVDMNNITKALFLGNEASCCTSVGRGTKQETAPYYVKNKFIGAIEITDSDYPIGNSICYFAKVNGNLSLVLDNIELLPSFKNNNDIKHGIFEYARELCKDVGKPDIPIYVVGHRNKIDLTEQETAYQPLRVIGSSGEDKVYFDFLTGFIKIDPQNPCLHDVELTKVQ